MSSRGRGRNNRRTRPDNAAQHNVPQPGFLPPHDASWYLQPQEQTPSTSKTMLPFYTRLASLHQSMTRLHREIATVQEDIAAVYSEMAASDARSDTEKPATTTDWPQSHLQNVSYHTQPHTVDPTDNTFHSWHSDEPFVPQTRPMPHSLDQDHREPGDVSRAYGRTGNGAARNNHRRRCRRAGHLASQAAGENNNDRLGYLSPAERVMEELSGSSSLGFDLRDGQSSPQHLETGFWDGVQNRFETQTGPRSQPTSSVLQQLPYLHVTQPSPSSTDPFPPSADPSPAVNNPSPKPNRSIHKDEKDTNLDDASLSRYPRCSFVNPQERLFRRNLICSRYRTERETLLRRREEYFKSDAIKFSDIEQHDYLPGSVFQFEEPAEVNESDDGVVENLDHILRRGRTIWRVIDC